MALMLGYRRLGIFFIFLKQKLAFLKCQETLVFQITIINKKLFKYLCERNFELQLGKFSASLKKVFEKK